MSVLRDAFLPPEGVTTPCADWPDAWIVEPVAPASGRPREAQLEVAAQFWPVVEAGCARCPVLDACRAHGLLEENLDDPMVYGGLSRHMRQKAVRGWITTDNGTTTTETKWLA